MLIIICNLAIQIKSITKIKIIKMTTQEKLDLISIKLFNIKYNDLINKDRDIVFKQYLKENAI